MADPVPPDSAAQAGRTTRADAPHGVWLPAASGAAAAVAGVGAGGLAAVLAAPGSSPLLAVGALVIDLVPGWLKDAVISLFGTGDKDVLLVSLGVVLLVAAAAGGLIESRRPPLGQLLFALAGAIGVLAAVTRAGADLFSAIPSAVGAVVGIIALSALSKRLPAPRTRTKAPQASGTARIPSAAERRAAQSDRQPAGIGDSRRLGRRGFLVWTAGLTVAGALAAWGGAALTAGANAAIAARRALRLPRPARAAPPIPAGASFRIPQLTPIVTPNADFYRIDTALQVPEIDPTGWSLEVGGMVRHPFRLTWDELIRLPLEESYTTLACVSNEVGGDLISNAKWLGYPIRHLLARAKPLGSADCVLSTSQDGWTATTPLAALTDGREAILAIGMNGQPLPFDHGFPVRMVVPGLYGYVSATKWVVKLEVTQFSRTSSYWSERGWSVRGPIKLESRIDVPTGGQPLAAGRVVVAGVAWDQHTGIRTVEVRVDDGPWQAATLAEPINIDTWRQWRWEWEAARGDHTLAVRATNERGEVQTAVVAPPAPDGASGYDRIRVTVS